MALLGDQGEAEETAQEVLLAAYDGLPGYRGESSIRGWLLGIARRKCAKRLAMRGRRERRLRLVHDADREAQLPDEAIERGRRARLVREAIERLKPTEREAVLLRYQSGLSYREIGESCEIEEATARKRVSRALGRMRTILKGGLGE
jgi:RNA polymerase sigma-70 factor (ECF subfamily)